MMEVCRQNSLFSSLILPHPHHSACTLTVSNKRSRKRANKENWMNEKCPIYILELLPQPKSACKEISKVKKKNLFYWASRNQAITLQNIKVLLSYPSVGLLWRPARCASTARSPLLPAGCSLQHPWCSAASSPTSLSDVETGNTQSLWHLCCPEGDTCALLQKGMQGCSPISRGGGGFGLPWSLQLYICTQTWPQPGSYRLPSIII